MRRVIDLVGTCTLVPQRDYFLLLCKAIFNQQISMAVAAALFARFEAMFPKGKPTPRAVLEAISRDGEVLRGCGLSRQKRAYVHSLAEHFHTRKIPTRRLARMGDEEVIETLTQVKGIGRWTAEMFLIFTLNRPDVLPVDDLGLQKGAQLVFGLEKMPDKQTLTKMGEAWRPYRSIATWYIWRGIPKLIAETKRGNRDGGAASSPRRSRAAKGSPAPAPRPARRSTKPRST
jgi:DNA-3-methyladenine glycosylase II